MSSRSAETDLFEVVGTAAEFAAVCRAALDRVGWPPGEPGAAAADLDAEITRELDRARASLAGLRDGSWPPLERHLEELGRRYARVGLPVSAWHLIAAGLSSAMMERAIAAFPADPARLTAVLRGASAVTERAALAVARGYAAAAQPERAERGTFSEDDESLALRAHAVEQAQFGIVVSHPETRRISNVNPAYERLVGYTAAELIGSTGEALIAPVSQDAIAAAQRTLRARGHHTYHLSLRRKDGSTVPVLASSSTARTRSGTTVRISTVVDITEQVELEQARAAAQHELERSAARLAILSSASHEFASSAGDVDALLALVARRLAEIIGESCVVRLISDDGAWLEPTSHVFHPDPQLGEETRRLVEHQRKPVTEGLIGRVATTGAAVRMPTVDLARLATGVTPGLHELFVRSGVSSILIVPLRSRGRTVGVLSMLRTRGAPPYSEDDQRLAQDLADRAGLAVDNAMLVATLEHRVVARTTALEAANKELEAFSYSVSHDLRTPLRSIDGFSLALIEDCTEQLDDRARDYLQRIRAGASRMSSLIDDLLALARVSRAALDIVALDLSALAAEIVGEIRRRDPARETPVHVATGLAAQGDARLIRIALENLLGNAWKYTARHPAAQIWIGAEGATFHIRDTGAGFDMTYAEKLFAPFQRLHGSREYEGTGIGLAIVDRIVSHHGGRIWATGEVDRGATFFFTLGERRAAP